MSFLRPSAALACAFVAALPLTGRADQYETIRRTSTLRWGCDAQGGAPYVYKDPHSLDSYVGFEVELAQAIGESLGVTLQRVQTQWDKLLPGLERGDFDVVINGLEMTTERRDAVLFSAPYYISTLEIAVRKKAPMTPSLVSLRGRRAAALRESFAERLLKEAGGIEVKSYDDVIAAYIDLKNGHVDAVVMDAPIALYYGRGPEFSHAPADFGEARYGVAMPLGEARLAVAIDHALEGAVKSGRLQRIYERYGVWNQPTAELFGVKYISPPSEPPLLKEFFRRTTTLRDRLNIYRSSLGAFGLAGVMTLTLSVTGMAIAVLLGLALALLRLYGPGPLRASSAIYIEGIRGTPLLIQLYIIFYALPDIGLNLPPFVAAVLGLGLNYAAYEAENYRAGLMSISIGQSEAAHSLGLTHLQTLRHVIVPQALRLVISPVTNDFIALLKDSSIVSVIAMVELTETYNELASATGDRVGLGLVAGAFYFLLGWPFARLAAALEERTREGRR